jgi:transposase
LVRGAGGELEARDEEKEAHWTLDALTTTAREHGITVGRSQVRRILKAEGVRWRNVHPWGESHDPEEFVPKGRKSSRSTPTHPRRRRSSASTS